MPSLSLLPTDICFYAFGILGVLFSLLVVLGKNPITSAFSLVLVFFSVAAVYALQEAHFLAGIQILVYAGAVMVLFVFVIMLLNADIKNADQGKRVKHTLKKTRAFQLGATVGCTAVFALFVFGVARGQLAEPNGALTTEKIQSLGGNFRVISELMFSDYILPFEITSILLLVGIVGSVALAKRKA